MCALDPWLNGVTLVANTEIQHRPRDARGELTTKAGSSFLVPLIYTLSLCLGSVLSLFLHGVLKPRMTCRFELACSVASVLVRSVYLLESFLGMTTTFTCSATRSSLSSVTDGEKHNMWKPARSL